MGASEFAVTIEAKTADAAFLKAQEQARDEHGRGGYTGSIAESNGYRMVNVDAEAAKLVARLEEKLAKLTVAGQAKLAKDIERARSHGNFSYADRLGEDTIYTLGHLTVADACKAARERTRRSIKELKGKRTRAMAVTRHFDVNQLDKWGPAMCVKAGPNLWHFFGMASS